MIHRQGQGGVGGLVSQTQSQGNKVTERDEGRESTSHPSNPEFPAISLAPSASGQRLRDGHVDPQRVPSCPGGDPEQTTWTGISGRGLELRPQEDMQLRVRHHR